MRVQRNDKLQLFPERFSASITLDKQLLPISKSFGTSYLGVFVALMVIFSYSVLKNFLNSVLYRISAIASDQLILFSNLLGKIRNKWKVKTNDFDLNKWNVCALMSREFISKDTYKCRFNFSSSADLSQMKLLQEVIATNQTLFCKFIYFFEGCDMYS